MEAGFVREGRAWKVGVIDHVRNPSRLGSGPDPPRQADAGDEGVLTREGLKLGHLDGGPMPDLNTPQNLALRLYLPDRPHVPTQVFADSAKEVGRRLKQFGRFCKNTRDLILGGNPPLLPLPFDHLRLQTGAGLGLFR